MPIQIYNYMKILYVNARIFIQYYTKLYNIIHTLRIMPANYLQINKQHQNVGQFDILLYKLSVQTYRMHAVRKSLIFFDYLIILHFIFRQFTLI